MFAQKSERRWIMVLQKALHCSLDRRHFIGGSDARIIMGEDEKALIRLWQEKRGEVGPEDLSANLFVQLGLATEDLSATPDMSSPRSRHG
jgi:predicted phage-related endonuclease